MTQLNMLRRNDVTVEPPMRVRSGALARYHRVRVAGKTVDTFLTAAAARRKAKRIMEGETQP